MAPMGTGAGNGEGGCAFIRATGQGQGKSSSTNIPLCLQHPLPPDRCWRLPSRAGCREHPPPPETWLSPLFPCSRGWGRGAGSCLTFPRGSRSRAYPTLCLQVTPFPEAYRETLHTYKISEQDTDVRANVHPACPPSAPCCCPCPPQQVCYLHRESCAKCSCTAGVGPGAAPSVVCAAQGLNPPLSLADWSCPMSRFGPCHPGWG